MTCLYDINPNESALLLDLLVCLHCANMQSMKTFRFQLILWSILLGIALPSAEGTEPAVAGKGAEIKNAGKQNKAESAAAVKQKLSAVTVPAISITKCNISDLVDFLNAQLGKWKSDIVMEYKPSPGESSAPIIPKLYLKDASIAEILEQGCKAAGCSWYVEENVVIVHSTNLLITRTYPIEFGMLYMEFHRPGKNSAKELLMRAGMDFPRESSAEFDAAGRLLTLVNKSSEHEMMKSVMDRLGDNTFDEAAAEDAYKRYLSALNNVSRTLRTMKIRNEKSVEKRLFALRDMLRKSSGKKGKELINYWLFTHDNAREVLDKAAEECIEAIDLLQDKMQKREMDKASATANHLEKDIREFLERAD